ncbi:MAG: conjugal transfer protein TraF, partial [Candidatus Nitrotoga sp.]
MRLAYTLLATVLMLMPFSVTAIEWRDYPSGMGYPSEWSCSGQGKFNWYCEDEPAPAKADKAPPVSAETREEMAVKELEAIRKELDAKRALSVVHPTEENIRAYMAAQQVEIVRAAYYADVWRRVLWQNAELNLALKNPMNNSAIKVKNTERDKNEI